jgi:hypothetical protein
VLDLGEEHVPHEEIHVSKDMWRNQMMTSVKVQLAFQVCVSHESK